MTTTTMSHHKLSSSLSVKASVLTLVVMVAGILFAAAPSSAMAQQITATSSPGLPLPMSPPTNETGGGEIPTLLPPTTPTGDTVFSTNETGGITAPPTNETGGGEIPTLLPPTTPTGDTVFSTNETGGITPPPTNETEGIAAPPLEVLPAPTNETGGITPAPTNETEGITAPPIEGGAEPLTAEITANPIEGDAPLTVELSAVVAGGTEPYTYSWDFGDGSAESDQPTVQHIFENPFIYNVTLTVSDATGQVVTANLDITVYEPLPPAEEPPAEEPPAEEPPAEEPPAEEPPAEEPPAEEPPITGT